MGKENFRATGIKVDDHSIRHAPVPAFYYASKITVRSRPVNLAQYMALSISKKNAVLGQFFVYLGDPDGDRTREA
jgi:hypothetical protein